MKLSIITINYNNAEGLRKTMESVLAQTYTEIEYIIVDGASTDGSVDVIRELATRPTIKWVSEKDTGIYNAMNKGIEIALGRRIVNSLNRSELVEDKNKEIEVALGRRVVNDDHTSSPHRPIASSPHRLSDYIQILNSGDILAAPDVTERMMAALEENVKQQHQQQNTNNHSVMEQHTITANENNALSPNSLIASSPIQNRPAILYGNMIKEYPDGRRVNDECLGNEKSKPLSIHPRRVEWTLLDFIKGTINHDPTYIHRSLYERYGLYDDTLKIVSDWKWFINAVVLHSEHVFYVPIDVTIFDMTGISETNLQARGDERRQELENMFPMTVLKDYDDYYFPIIQYKRLRRRHLWKIVSFVERVLFKLEKWKLLK